jgi:hypothetical protein
MDKKDIQAELDKINQAIAAQEALHGVLPDAQIEIILSPLRRKKAELTAQLPPGDVAGSVAAGEQGQVGGIRANRIEAENVVSGVQLLGGDLTDAAHALALAEALRQGGITANSIQARNVVAGFQYIADPSQATPEELRQEVAWLRTQLSAAVATGELAQTADVDDAQEALQKAEAELAKAEPQGGRIIRKLREATDILTEGARTAETARKAGQTVVKLAPVAAALYQIATQLFGG